MSDMTIEKAREIVEQANPHNNQPLPPNWEYQLAKGFLDGHASRDPEVADLKIKILTLTNNAKGTPWTQGEIEAASARAVQTERILELKEAAREVMTLLDKHGPSIVPHLIDTDENAGQRLRQLCGLA